MKSCPMRMSWKEVAWLTLWVLEERHTQKTLEGVNGPTTPGATEITTATTHADWLRADPAHPDT